MTSRNGWWTEQLIICQRVFVSQISHIGKSPDFPDFDALRSDGVTSLGRIAEALNERGMLTPRRGRWHKSSVRNLIARLEVRPVNARDGLTS